MADYHVTAMNQEACASDANYVHVTAIETRNGPLDVEVWTAAEVCQAIAQGDHFYVQSRDILQKTMRLAFNVKLRKIMALPRASAPAGTSRVF